MLEQKTINNLCGLTWAESGQPFFICVAGEVQHDKAATFADPDPTVEIVYEGTSRTFAELIQEFEIVKNLHCRTIYTILEPKHLTFIRDFNKWRHSEKSKLMLKQTKSSSFEASLLKVKELIADKRLIFPTESVIRTQLTTFSKTNLKDSGSFFAVKALTMVIDGFGGKKAEKEEIEVPNQRGWW